MVEETQAGRSHQQSTSGVLPEGLEDPPEVSRPLYRWIRAAFFHHKRGTLPLGGKAGLGHVRNLVFLVDDGRGNQVCRSGGVSLEPCTPAGVQAAACGDCDGPGSGG